MHTPSTTSDFLVDTDMIVSCMWWHAILPNALFFLVDFIKLDLFPVACKGLVMPGANSGCPKDSSIRNIENGRYFEYVNRWNMKYILILFQYKFWIPALIWMPGASISLALHTTDGSLHCLCAMQVLRPVFSYSGCIDFSGFLILCSDTLVCPLAVYLAHESSAPILCIMRPKW